MIEKKENRFEIKNRAKIYPGNPDPDGFMSGNRYLDFAADWCNLPRWNNPKYAASGT